MFLSRIRTARSATRVFSPGRLNVGARWLATDVDQYGADKNQPTATDIPHFKILVVGGGTAGMAVASQLIVHHYDKIVSASAVNSPSIGIIEPQVHHYYQPLWTLVGGGVKSFEESRHLTQDVMKPFIETGLMSWIQNRVDRLIPSHNRVRMLDGTEVSYDYLVVASGIQINWHQIPGLAESLGNDDLRVSSNYSPDHVEKTWKYIQEFTGGNALFTQPSTPIKCAGAPQKICYLAEEYWRHRGLRRPQHETRVIFNSGMGKIFAVDKYAQELTKICKEREIEVGLNAELIEIRPARREAVFKRLAPDSEKGQVETIPFCFMHVAPPMGPPSFLKESGLTNAAGWLDVDTKFLQNRQHRNVFALGDCSSLPTSKTAAAAAAQSAVLVHNLVEQLQADAQLAPGSQAVNETSLKAYDGYTSCPLVTGRGKLILAEFSGYSLQPQETFWFDQKVERASMFALKNNVMPTMYWEGMLRGRWMGPESIRPIFNPFNWN